jgi:hypothetical protein
VTYTKDFFIKFFFFEKYVPKAARFWGIFVSPDLKQYVPTGHQNI